MDSEGLIPTHRACLRILAVVVLTALGNVSNTSNVSFAAEAVIPAPAALSASPPETTPPITITPGRQKELIHIVRQDCGSCHGLTLKGGLGPALTAPSLRQWQADNLAATILYGRPGTPMPPFTGILDQADVAWIAQQLLNEFPEEH